MMTPDPNGMCAKGLHLRTKTNVYVNPLTGYMQCKPCKDDARDAARAKAKKSTPPKRPPINPEIAARLRAEHETSKR